MKRLLNRMLFLIIFVFTGQTTLFGQRDNFKSFDQLDTLKKRKLFIKIYTDYWTYKGSLYRVNDSSVGIMKGRQIEGLPEVIAVKDIQQIVFTRKNTLLKNMLEGFAAGAVLGAFYAMKYYLETPSYDREYSFGENVLYGSIAGAGLGIIIGAVSRSFYLRAIIPIYKSQRLFEEKKSRLKEFVIY